MTDRELMQMALDALESCLEDENQDGETFEYFDWRKVEAAKKALRIRIEQPEPKTNWIRVTKKDVHGNEISWFKPKGEWVGLTDEEVGGLTVFDGLTNIEVPILADFVRAIEAKLKEKNT